MKRFCLIITLIVSTFLLPMPEASPVNGNVPKSSLTNWDCIITKWGDTTNSRKTVLSL